MTLDEILKAPAEMSNVDRAKQCLAWVANGDGADPRCDGYLAASQTFALLAIADALRTSGSGRSIADAVAFAGDMQP